MKTTYSFEFFPPKTEAAEAAFWNAIPTLAALHPAFMTVTYGAGGGTRDKTLDMVARLRGKTNLPVAAHLTFINTTKEDVLKIADALWENGTRHIVALRGDLPAGLSWPLDFDENYFQHTSEFIRSLRARHGFEISVAAYPEKHPDSKSFADDIQALKRKCDAGATRAITQFFFENEKFYRFLEQCDAAGITTPIVPGILPIHDFKAMARFAAKCQATIPASLADGFARFENSPADSRKFATEILTAQALDLAAHGIPHIHFYTLNKSGITAEVCTALQG